MIIFNNTEIPTAKLLEDVNSKRIFNIEVAGKALMDRDLLSEMTTILQGFLFQEDKVIITMNSLDEAMDNNDPEENPNYVNDLFVFKAMINEFVNAGHEIAIYAVKGKVVPDLLEMDEMDGVEIFYDIIPLTEYINTNT